MSNRDLQDSFLNEVKSSEEIITVFLVNGFQMKGTITNFDKYVIELMIDGKSHLIYKHAISTFQK